MKICDLKVNHLVNPVGYALDRPAISYTVSEARGRRQARARVEVSLTETFDSLIYDSGEREDIVSTAFELPIETAPETRYYWRVTVADETGDAAVSETAYFETGKAGDWQADWISPVADKSVQAVLTRSLFIDKPVKRARAYMTGLGLYEFYLNGEKVGDEYLTPGFCAYDSWIQYQTYALTLRQGENALEIMLGDGWYKGHYGLNVKKENYGDRLAAIAEIHILYEDGSRECLCTDTSWKARPGKVLASGIYPGETYDAALAPDQVYDTEVVPISKDLLCDRLSLPITIHEQLTPVEIIHTPAGETVLDMGQNMVGWVAFKTSAPKGYEMGFQVGEILQEGNFYRDNLRTAPAEYHYIADGRPDTWVRQHFTFYGFRYVKLNHWYGQVRAEDFRGLVLYSDMEEIGQITTSDPLVNRLFLNAMWGQKGNFLDVPTDCPQRDERCGWTGDAQIFSGTACFNMDTFAFYKKFGKDLWAEQQKLGGSVPDVVPVANFVGDASTGWADAATVIPWNVYLHYGDKGILAAQFDSMKGWVDYMKREDDRDGGRRLWLTGHHYADWLALDGAYPGGVYGATDPDMIASAYYYYSATLTAKAAHVLDRAEEAAYYDGLAEEIRQAFFREYFTPSGRLAVDTMTAYILTLYFELYPEGSRERLADGLLHKLQKNRYHLESGFLGTPFLCRMLSEHGHNDLAYHLLLEKGYPGWLYEVLMGATTVWERWNSVEPDGRISGTEMNSLNHYAYGSIVEWMYRYMAGIRPVEEAPGYKRFILAPKPDYRISSCRAGLRSAAGTILSSWQLEKGQLCFDFTVPFDAQAEIILPDADRVMVNGQRLTAETFSGQALPGISRIKQDGRDMRLTAAAGSYHIVYTPTVPYRKTYSLLSPLEELDADPRTYEILKKEFYSVFGEDYSFKRELYTLQEHLSSPFQHLPEEKQQEIDRLLRSVEV